MTEDSADGARDHDRRDETRASTAGNSRSYIGLRRQKSRFRTSRDTAAYRDRKVDRSKTDSRTASSSFDQLAVEHARR